MPAAEAAGRGNTTGPFQGALAFVLVILTWASMPLFLKYFTQFLDGWTVNGVRYAIATFLWLPYLLYYLRRGAITPGIYKDAWLPAVCHIFGQVCWGLSPYYNDASIMHFIGRSTFLFMILFGFLLLHEERRLIARPVFWFGVAGTVIGVVCMYIGGARHGGTSPLGVLLLLGAGAGWASYGVTVKKYMGRHSARLSFAVISLYTAPGLIAIMLLFGDWRQMAGLAVSTWGWLALSAVTGIAMAHVLLYVVLKKYGPIVSDGVFQLIPFLTVVGAYLLFGEHMTALQWLGGFILIGAAYALLLAKREASAAPPG
jgi:drug/metabolite transporter (DMT)-like permease